MGTELNKNQLKSDMKLVFHDGIFMWIKSEYNIFSFLSEWSDFFVQAYLHVGTCAFLSCYDESFL